MNTKPNQSKITATRNHLLSGYKRQSKTVPNDLKSTFVDSINVFDCRISEVFIEYWPTEYIAGTIRNKGYYE